jgi:hypothetical protein
MIKHIEETKLKLLVDAYTESVGPNETRTCRIELADLREFVNRIESMKANGIRIYLTRPDELEYKIGRTHNVNHQLSFLVVPTTGDKGISDLYEGDRILVLEPGGENTGLCPPYCP